MLGSRARRLNTLRRLCCDSRGRGYPLPSPRESRLSTGGASASGASRDRPVAPMRGARQQAAPPSTASLLPTRFALVVLALLVVPQVGLEPTTDGLPNILVVAVSLLVHVSTLLSTWQTMPALPPAPVMPALPVLPTRMPPQISSSEGESALSEDYANDTEPSPAFTADSPRLGRGAHRLGNEHEGGGLQ